MSHDFISPPFPFPSRYLKARVCLEESRTSVTKLCQLMLQAKVGSAAAERKRQADIEVGADDWKALRDDAEKKRLDNVGHSTRDGALLNAGDSHNHWGTDTSTSSKQGTVSSMAGTAGRRRASMEAQRSARRSSRGSGGPSGRRTSRGRRRSSGGSQNSSSLSARIAEGEELRMEDMPGALVAIDADLAMLAEDLPRYVSSTCIIHSFAVAFIR